MNVKRVAVLGVVGGAMVAWFAAASTTGRRPVIDQVTRKTTAVELRGAELAAEIARLRERLRPGTAPQTPGRNLFEFSRRAPAAIASPPPAPVISDSGPPPPAAPGVKLIGIAEDAGAEGPIRTAIISGFGQVFLAKIGERVTDRFEVAKISSDAAQLMDLS